MRSAVASLQWYGSPGRTHRNSITLQAGTNSLKSIANWPRLHRVRSMTTTSGRMNNAG